MRSQSSGDSNEEEKEKLACVGADKRAKRWEREHLQTVL